jgi:L-iditol 2-dehydrogenase
MTVQAVKAYGATMVIAVDLEDNRLQLAGKIGATATINSGRTDVAAKVRALTGSDGVDIVFDAAGAGSTIRLTTKLVRRGGRVVWIGLPGEDEIPLNVVELIDKEADVRGVFRYANVYPQAISLIEAGVIDVRPLLTHELPLDRVEEALNIAHERRDGAVKVMVTVP